MHSAQVFRNRYIDLYKELRKYLWDFDVICVIADIETEVYKIFPDILKLQGLVDKLRRLIFEVVREDPEMKAVVDAFVLELDDNPEVVSFIKTFKEVNLG